VFKLDFPFFQREKLILGKVKGKWIRLSLNWEVLGSPRKPRQRFPT